MRAELSVVIPTLNAGRGLPPCLAALMEGVEAGVIREVIMTDGGSGDATGLIAEEAGAVWLSGPAGRGGQIARGVDRAQGSWILILHADTELLPGWVAPVADHLAGSPMVAGYGRLAFDRGGLPARIVAGWANLRSRLFGLPYGDQGLLVSARLLEEQGGFPDLPLMEDVAIARALRGRLIPLDFTARTDAGKYETEGWFRRGRRNLWTLCRYLCGVSPERLAQDYRRSGRRT
ncbi:MAG: glycosyl transferase [Rhodobacterales bacterium]|nr:MAG: glycosyl transferase [Rhodobacterales bacterium]